MQFHTLAPILENEFKALFVLEYLIGKLPDEANLV